MLRRSFSLTHLVLCFFVAVVLGAFLNSFWHSVAPNVRIATVSKELLGSAARPLKGDSVSRSANPRVTDSRDESIGTAVVDSNKTNVGFTAPQSRDPLPVQDQNQIIKPSQRTLRAEYEGQDAVQMNEDSIACQALEERETKISEAGAPVIVRSLPTMDTDAAPNGGIYEACMRSRGWKF
jgi:hypothetical protein